LNKKQSKRREVEIQMFKHIDRLAGRWQFAVGNPELDAGRRANKRL